MKFKILAAALLGCLFVFLTGCSSTVFNNSELMRPPRATGDKAAIQAVIEAKAGGDYTLKYPQKGDYRSAIIMTDIDSNGTEEAIALYKPSGDTKAGIHILIIAELDGVWQAVGDYTNQCSEVDRICLADLNGNGNKEILVGWSTYNQNINHLTGYAMHDKAIEELEINTTYSDMVVSDLTGDGTDSIMLMTLASTDVQANATLLEFNKDSSALLPKSTVEMDSSITSFSNVLVGQIDDSTKGVFIDGVAVANNLSTQLIYYSNGLKNPLLEISEDTQKPTNTTARTTSTICKDINDDGLIEVPIVSLMDKESSEAVENVSNLITWDNYVIPDKFFSPTLHTVPNYSDGYYFILPPEWENNVTARIDTTKRQLIFYEWINPKDKDESGTRGEALLTIQVFTEKDWNDRKNTAGYTEMKSSTGLVYAVYVGEGSSQLSLPLSTVSDNLKLIKEK